MRKSVQPDGWERPRGYSNAVMAQGEQIYVAGQIGWNERHEIVSDDFVDQAAQALRNIVTILHACRSRPSDLVRLTWYVTDKAEYESAAVPLGETYRQIIGAHFPAMTLVQVSALLEEGAKVEIEATAVRSLERRDEDA